MVDPRFVVWLSDGAGPYYTVVSRLRLAGSDIGAVVGEVRALLRSHGREASTWEIGMAATPDGLEARLCALGMRPVEDADVAGLVLTADPGDVPGVEVRRAKAPADYEEAERIKLGSFAGSAPSTAEDVRLRAEAQRLDDEESGRGLTFLAYVDGRPVGAARLLLCGPGAVFNAGCVLPDARGRGAYRALVAARAEAARQAGAPAVVTQAGRMSRPILERLGFVEVTRVRVLVDAQ